jgi:hypothetical protein
LPGNFRNEKHQVQHKNLSAIWAVGKALTKKNYPDAFKLITIATAGQPDSTQKLLGLLTRVLREEHVLKSIQKAYSSISYEEVKTLLGLQDAADQQVKQFLTDRKWTVQGGKFVVPSEIDADRKRFELTEGRIDHLADVVQFLE